MTQAPKGVREPGETCMQMAADLAAFYSDLGREGKAAVTYISPKHVSKPRGAPLGAVKLREGEGSTIVGRPDGVPDRLIVERDAFDRA